MIMVRIKRESHCPGGTSFVYANGHVEDNDVRDEKVPLIHQVVTSFLVTYVMKRIEIAARPDRK